MRSEANTSKIRSMQVILAFSCVLMVVKFLAYFLTHSNSILTDALESIINVVAGGFALYSVYFASQPKDEDHPYGHGKIEFLSAGFEGALIFIAGAGMIVKSVYGFFHLNEIHSLDIGIYISVFAGICNYFMGTFLIKRGNKFNSVLMVADGKHLISDTVSSIGVIVGLIVIYFTQLYWLDNLVALLFGAFIFHTGYKLVKESVTNLLDETDKGKIDHLIKLLNIKRREKWIDIHNLRILKYGNHLHVDCHITLPWYDTLEDSHHEVSMVENLIKSDLGNEVEFFIHSDPCIPPASCKICQLENCKERKAEFISKLEWTIDNMLPNKKHGVTIN